MQPPPKKRIQPRRALAAMQRLIANPDDTAQFAVALESLEGDAPRRLHRRLQRSERGRALLSNPPDLISRLSDTPYLRSLKADSLGRAYLSFCERERKSSAALIEVIEQGRARAHGSQSNVPHHFVMDWMRDTHDLYHLVLGYGTDLLGELGVLSFTAAQTGNVGVVLPVLFGMPRLARERPSAIALGARAVRRGLTAEFFPEQSWPDLLERPLGELRQALGVGEPERYEPLYFARVA